MWRIAACLLSTAAVACLASAAAAQPQDPGAAAPPAPAAAPPAPPSPEQLARLFDPEMLALLRERYGRQPRGDTGVTGPGNFTVVSIPEGAQVFLAPMSEVQGATKPDGSEASVEDIVFTDAHLLGTAPLTARVETGEYVLAVRSAGRNTGFDGGCVRKTTMDVITGGPRHSYHLYSIRKKDGEYMCVVANFAAQTAKLDQALAAQTKRGTFAIPEDELVSALADKTRVPEEVRQSVTARLNQLGAAFYKADDTQYLVKLSIRGGGFTLEEWPAE